MSDEAFYDCLGRCPECPGDHRLVCGDGPTQCAVMFIGEAPGQEEDSGGRPFIGRSGRELNENYMPRMGLNRPNVRFTNSVKCRPENNKTPSDKLRISCASHFIAREIQLCKPELIVLMGATASKLLNRKIKLERHHGLPFKLKPGEGGLLGDYTGWVVCLYHPAAGMHNTSMMTPLLADATNLRLWLNEQWEPPVDKIPNRTYELVDDINTFTRTFSIGLPTGVDTESDSHGEFWSAQYSQIPGTGYAIMTRNTYLMKQFADALTENSNAGGIFVAQNTLVDYDPLYRLGMRLHSTRIADTMQLAFQNGNMPQGLKSMSVRLCGVEMRDFEDVVLPHSITVLLSWVNEQIAVNSTMGTPRMWMENGELKSTPRPGPLCGKLEKFVESIHKARENSDSKIFKKAADFYLKYNDIRSPLTEPPRMGIEHVPFAEALYYMCQDPDITLRVYYELLNIAINDMKSGKYQQEPDPWRNLNLEVKTTGPVV